MTYCIFFMPNNRIDLSFLRSLDEKSLGKNDFLKINNINEKIKRDFLDYIYSKDVNDNERNEFLSFLNSEFIDIGDKVGFLKDFEELRKKKIKRNEIKLKLREQISSFLDLHKSMDELKENDRDVAIDLYFSSGEKEFKKLFLINKDSDIPFLSMNGYKESSNWEEDYNVFLKEASKNDYKPEFNLFKFYHFLEDLENVRLEGKKKFDKFLMEIYEKNQALNSKYNFDEYKRSIGGYLSSFKVFKTVSKKFALYVLEDRGSNKSGVNLMTGWKTIFSEGYELFLNALNHAMVKDIYAKNKHLSLIFQFNSFKIFCNQIKSYENLTNEEKAQLLRDFIDASRFVLGNNVTLDKKNKILKINGKEFNFSSSKSNVVYEPTHDQEFHLYEKFSDNGNIHGLSVAYNKETNKICLLMIGIKNNIDNNGEKRSSNVISFLFDFENNNVEFSICSKAQSIGIEYSDNLSKIRLIGKNCSVKTEPIDRILRFADGVQNKNILKITHEPNVEKDFNLDNSEKIKSNTNRKK